MGTGKAVSVTVGVLVGQPPPSARASEDNPPRANKKASKPMPISRHNSGKGKVIFEAEFGFISGSLHERCLYFTGPCLLAPLMHPIDYGYLPSG
jgi:hypothetical protein